jgi:hypothetical protein
MSSDTFRTADTIANGTALGAAGADLNNQHLVGIQMPAAWTAAALTFAMSLDGGTTWLNIYDQNGTELTVQAAASTYIALSPTLLTVPGLLRVRSGTSAVPVNQAADRLVTFLSHRYR